MRRRVVLLNLTTTTTTTLLTSLVEHHVGALCYNSYSYDFFSSRPQSLSLPITRTMSSLASTSTERSGSSELEIRQFPCLSDNYGYLIHDKASGITAAIDTPSSKEYIGVLEESNWILTHVLNTHHHKDHTGGNLDLKKTFDGVKIIGPAGEQEKIPGIDQAVVGGQTLHIGTLQVEVMDVGGHTKGHVAYYFPRQKSVFVGDSLFALGCGRMFEGTAQQFFTSLKKLRDLPDDTTVYWYVRAMVSMYVHEHANEYRNAFAYSLWCACALSLFLILHIALLLLLLLLTVHMNIQKATANSP
jgi:hypothetical protein